MTQEITLMATESAPFIELEPGAYAATITAIEPTDGQFGPQIKFTFTLDDQKKDDGSPIEMWAWTSQKLTAQSKLWKWALALGVTPVSNQEFKVSALLHKRAQVLVNMVDSEQGPRPRIVDVFPPRAGRTSATPAAVAAAPPVEDGCEVTGCTATVDRYTKGGKGLCATHTADDL